MGITLHLASAHSVDASSRDVGFNSSMARIFLLNVRRGYVLHGFQTGDGLSTLSKHDPDCATQPTDHAAAASRQREALPSGNASAAFPTPLRSEPSLSRTARDSHRG